MAIIEINLFIEINSVFNNSIDEISRLGKIGEFGKICHFGKISQFSKIDHFGKIGQFGKIDHFGKIGHSSKSRPSSVIN